MCEKETNRRKEENEENERRMRAISHSVEGYFQNCFHHYNETITTFLVYV